MRQWTTLDLFSGAGGMSYGFHATPQFRIIGAVDAQVGKPSSGRGTLECNKTYQANIGVEPLQADLAKVSGKDIAAYLKRTSGTTKVDILISCAPCTGFSRTIRQNLVNDDPRNSLVVRSAEYVRAFHPSIFVMENVGELLSGKFTHHYKQLAEKLDALGYSVHGRVHSLNDYGLPQTRRRALVIAVKRPLTLRTLEDLWQGYKVNEKATTVRHAIGDLPEVSAGKEIKTDRWHSSPDFTDQGLRRLSLIPHDGGSWPDLLRLPDGRSLLIPSMRRQADKGRVGPHRDVYGRLSWNLPAVTIKRECAHIGNGRYAHPVQDRLCTVREMGIFQGFPRDYKFEAKSLSNMYRHIGDAVPPLISYQVAKLCQWILTGKRPNIASLILPRTHLKLEDIIPAEPAPKQLELDEAGLAQRQSCSSLS